MSLEAHELRKLEFEHAQRAVADFDRRTRLGENPEVIEKDSKGTAHRLADLPNLRAVELVTDDDDPGANDALL